MDQNNGLHTVPQLKMTNVCLGVEHCPFFTGKYCLRTQPHHATYGLPSLCLAAGAWELSWILLNMSRVANSNWRDSWLVYIVHNEYIYIYTCFFFNFDGLSVQKHHLGHLQLLVDYPCEDIGTNQHPFLTCQLRCLLFSFVFVHDTTPVHFNILYLLYIYTYIYIHTYIYIYMRIYASFCTYIDIETFGKH